MNLWALPIFTVTVQYWAQCDALDLQYGTLPFLKFVLDVDLFLITRIYRIIDTVLSHYIFFYVYFHDICFIWVYLFISSFTL